MTWLTNPAHTLACRPHRTPCRPSQSRRQRAGKLGPWATQSRLPGSFPAGQGLSWNRFPFTVTKSKCPSYVGVTGILLQETKHVFKIITEEDRLKGTRCPLGRALWAVAVTSPSLWPHRRQGPAGATPAPGGTGAAPLVVSLWVQEACEPPSSSPSSHRAGVSRARTQEIQTTCGGLVPLLFFYI